MKSSRLLIFTSAILALLISCADEAPKKQAEAVPQPTKQVEQPAPEPEEEEVFETPTDKGIGPVESLELEPELDDAMVEKGHKSFKMLCTACHTIDKKIIGPPLKNVTKRRTPEWIMNMMLNPDQMLKENPIAIKLLEEYVAPMTDQQVTEEEARAILEYLRSEDS